MGLSPAPKERRSSSNISSASSYRPSRSRQMAAFLVLGPDGTSARDRRKKSRAPSKSPALRNATRRGKRPLARERRGAGSGDVETLAAGLSGVWGEAGAAASIAAASSRRGGPSATRFIQISAIPPPPTP